MKNKIITILLMLSFLLSIIIFIGVSSISLPIELGVSRIILDHAPVEAVEISEVNYPLYAYSIPRQKEEELIWSVSDSIKAEIVNGNYLKAKEEGKVEVTVSSKDGRTSESFLCYLYKDKGEGLQDILLFDSSANRLTNNESFKYGEYSFDSSLNRINGSTSISYIAIPTRLQDEVELSIEGENATLSKDNVVTFKDENDVVIKAKNKNSKLDGYEIVKELTLDVIPNGYNVYTYEELMECTNRSKEGEIVIMRSNLESRENAYRVLNDVDEEENLYDNTHVFGKLYDKNKYSHDVVTLEGRYDVTYLNNLKELGEDVSTTVNVGIYVQKDFYGNDFTINAHELTYPSLKSGHNEKPIPSKADIFQGPLSFVKVGVDALYVEVFGEDSATMYVSGDDITVSNLKLKSCNDVTDLTHLDYVGTTLEIDGNNIDIVNSVFSNGRNVVRSFSSTDVNLKNCYLYNAREFLLKIGSNNFKKPEPGKDIDSMNESEKREFLAPIPDDIEGKNSNIVVEDTIFYQSGFFSIGIDTHFCGEVLYGGNKYSLPGVKNLAGTSDATKLEIKGDTRFYDWKKVSFLDSSSLISASEGAEEYLKQMFDIQKLVRDYINNVNPSLGITKDDELYVHGGIAYYGGGRNYSIDLLTLSEEINSEMDEIKDMVVTGLPAIASGPYPFYFRLYSQNSSNNYFDQIPSEDLLNRN